MFDTVRLSAEVELNTSKLRKLGWTKFTSEKLGAEDAVEVYECWRPNTKGKHPHFLQYTPKRFELKLETSLPKVLHTSNIGLITPDELVKTFDEIGNRVGDWVGGDVPSVDGWNIRGRVDSVFAWQVGALVPDYLHALKSVNLSRHVSQSVDKDSTLYWRNAQRVIRLYDKFEETRDASAKGLLRFEVQSNHAKGEFERMAGTKKTKARDVLTWGNARAVLENYLQGLGADLVIGNEEKCIKMLAAKFGMTRAIRLFGYVQAMRVYSRDELIHQGTRRETIWRAIRDITTAGESVGVAKSGVLPALKLPDEYTGAPG